VLLENEQQQLILVEPTVVTAAAQPVQAHNDKQAHLLLPLEKLPEEQQLAIQR
jgi:hypothetical protein